MNWCTYDRTALAEAEVEHENHNSPSIWVRFALTSDPATIDPALKGKRVFGLIWTTTPWTIPANLAISFNPNYVYVAAETDGDVYIVAKDLLAATAETCGWSAPKEIARLAGMVQGVVVQIRPKTRFPLSAGSIAAGSDVSAKRTQIEGLL